MTVTAFTRHEVGKRLNLVLDQLAARIKRDVPALRYSVQQGSNDRFPWWVVARFVNGADESKVVDVSIDCQGTAQVWSIRADIARENGLVLHELPVMEQVPPQNEGQEPGPMERVVSQLEDFLMQQIACLIQELA